MTNRHKNIILKVYLEIDICHFTCLTKGMRVLHCKEIYVSPKNSLEVILLISVYAYVLAYEFTISSFTQRFTNVPMRKPKNAYKIKRNTYRVKHLDIFFMVQLL